MHERAPAPRESRQPQESGVIRQQVCPTCTEIAGEVRFRLKDKKGVHKCQICRSEMTSEYAAKLPGIKEAMRKEQERPR